MATGKEEQSDLVALIGLFAAVSSILYLAKYINKIKTTPVPVEPAPVGVYTPILPAQEGTLAPTGIKQYYYLYPADSVPKDLQPKPFIRFPVDPIYGCPEGWAAMNTGRAPGQSPTSYCQQVAVPHRISDWPVSVGYG